MKTASACGFAALSLALPHVGGQFNPAPGETESREALRLTFLRKLL